MSAYIKCDAITLVHQMTGRMLVTEKGYFEVSNSLGYSEKREFTVNGESVTGELDRIDKRTGFLGTYTVAIYRTVGYRGVSHCSGI